MREIFVAELAKEVLGPRNGIYELMPITSIPVDEYITGVLAPMSQVMPAPDIDIEAEIPSEEFSEESEDDTSEPEIASSIVFSPALNPQSRSHSLGISFMVATDTGLPRFDVCMTWAYYKNTDNGWIREPRYALLEAIDGRSRDYWFGATGNRVNNRSQATISLHILVKQQKTNEFLINMFFVNRIQVLQGRFPTTEHHVFQPQLRINCVEGTRLIPGLEGEPKNDEEKTLRFLYRDNPVLARGLLCSAYWREIDPENASYDQLDVPEVISDVPFKWLDGEILPVDARQKFEPCDLRTDFLPLYSVQAPLYEWSDEYGTPPELRADILAESFDPNLLAEQLQPIVNGYRAWISSLEQERRDLRASEAEIATKLIHECQEVAERIQLGINLLVENNEARLAFCFAMKAMSLQSVWPLRSGKRSLVWRSFQLAFILMALESIANPGSSYRNACDLLWVPTGAGKTEAYLALAAFVIAYRRRRALERVSGEVTGAGVAVISRYTLRLLTIQQFRRTLKMVTACELLRVHGMEDDGPIGWRPASYADQSDFIWGSSRFSAGLWVGGGVTPNHLEDIRNITGAINILKGQPGDGEPAQVVRCPACDSILSIPKKSEEGLPPDDYLIHLLAHGHISIPADLNSLSDSSITVKSVETTPLYQDGHSVLGIKISSAERVTAENVDTWWNQAKDIFGATKLSCVRASRPGYFIRYRLAERGAREQEYDFDIYCPNPECPLHHPWCEGSPTGCAYGVRPGVTGPTSLVLESGRTGRFPDGGRFTHVHGAFKASPTSPFVSDRIPIPAWTVDDQIYHRCPSIVIATVDKFARPPFEPRASALFGNVDHHHCLTGYYRLSNGHPSPAGRTVNARNYVEIAPLDPPDLILQDELHLIEGPLGSLVGLYETAIDSLSREVSGTAVKYIASTATIRQAEQQVQAIFNRELQTFPAYGLTTNDSFFIRYTKESEILNDKHAGRLYLAVCSPGRGPLTPVVRIWTRLLHTAWLNRNHSRIDPFWTLTGYFNAIRELAGARALYRQDIPERLDRISGANTRLLPDDSCPELSGRTPSTELPVILDLLNNQYPNAQDALFTTSMFGTGVDISRIGLMVVHGQPKTTSSYIQATGRVGRNEGALVVTFLRASRPRDLSHYEFFCGYHCQLHKFVEPITVMPFSPGALDRAIGPVSVFILRNRRNSTIPWYRNDTALLMANSRNDQEVSAIPQEMEHRAQAQPGIRAPEPRYTQTLSSSELDHWQQVARRQNSLRYVEYSIGGQPSSPVVLGDPQHQHAGFDVVYENAPQSLRDIEETCGFQT